MLRWLLVGGVLLVGLAAGGFGLFYAAGQGWLGEHEGPGAVRGAAVPAEVVADREAAQTEAARRRGAAEAKRILFGDLHVHTTFSFDAYFLSLPLMQGEGAHPPADACDFARYCSALDFWSINDHAEGLTPAHWRETVDSIRQCNAVAGDPEDPDSVAFLGWEWTQVGITPETHYGHKNVILRETGEEDVPDRPIASRGVASRVMAGQPWATLGYLSARGGGGRYLDFAKFVKEVASVPECPEGVPVRELPADCRERAETPDELFAKLDDWGFDSLVIPHGTTWGFYTPMGSSWDKQLAGPMHDPERQTLVEVFSGHGNSEEYRDWRGAVRDADGSLVCPEPSADYLPSCWRAGELIRERCEEAGLAADECDARAAEARRLYVQAGSAGHNVVPGARAEDWLDAGQCRDCFLPAFNYRPGGSAQYMLAIRNFDEPGEPRGLEFGFIASSDNHFARPGTGYKEFGRHGMTESADVAPEYRELLRGGAEEPVPRAVPFDFDTVAQPLRIAEAERQASFFMTGGLVAVHAAGRDRDAIWEALERREVYGTSGPRMLLWFDLMNAPDAGGGPAPMGSRARMDESPLFRVRAVGAFEQLPGCPDHAGAGLPGERLERLCKGECYHPSDERRLVTRIEVVKVRPQVRPDEPVAPLVEDPWRTFECPPDPAGCSVAFEDPDFALGGRDAIYYVRAVQEPGPAVNADSLRCERDAEGRCTEVNLCGRGPAGPDEDCLAETEERAWSSPIWIDHRG